METMSGTATHHVSAPSTCRWSNSGYERQHKGQWCLLCVAVAALNGSNGEGEGPLTRRIVAPAILTTPPPLAMLLFGQLYFRFALEIQGE